MTAPIAYTVQTAAEAVYGVSEDLLRKAVNSGKLKAKRTGPKGTGRIVIMRADLEAWLEGLDDAEAAS